MAYIGKAPTQGVRNRFYYTATSGQTTFSGADDNGLTLAYADARYTDVYLNGVLLVSGTDYTATTGTSISLTTGAATSDNIEILTYEISSLADVVSATSGGTFDGAVTFNSNISVDGGTIKLDGNHPVGSGNVALGDQALQANITGIQNTAIGSNAGATATQGYVTALGYNAASSASSSYSTIVAIGAGALQANTTGIDNLAVGGYNTLGVNTTGSYNIAVGREALASNTTTSNNTAVGYRSLYANTASNNTAVGYQSLYANTTGTGNAALGTNALISSTTGNYNTALGYASLYQNTTASNNTGIGWAALNSNTTGINNVALGAQALDTNTTASNNTAVGTSALGANTTGTNGVAVGYEALLNNVTGTENTALGTQVLRSNTASNNTGVGYGALFDNTTGSLDVAVGAYALTNNTTGTNNTVVGYGAGSSNTTGNNQTFFGKDAGTAATGSDNTLIGSGAGSQITTGGRNTILGRFNGNAGGLDIRTSDNYIVLSDGDGNRRLHSDASGNVYFGGVNNNPQDASGAGTGATTFRAGGLQLAIAVDNDSCAYFNRVRNDGTIVGFRQDGTQEGTISVSGTTVSYNGGHLSRWSRLADDSKDTSIVKGTVMTNLDAMVEWGDEDNEQLNKMAVSSVEGDANVAGVFVNWDEDDDWNDMNVAMTGDMVIRIANGTTVARGDLLMSAGDGTAKPQGDDIVRSKTIAKVTSTHVSHTYDDGSYLVPCVLMAC